MSDSIDILLSTYNGEKYLQVQIDSILHQRYKNWRLLVRDDGSTDGTTDIICRYAEKYPDRIVLVQDNLGNLGPAQSFNQLALKSDAPYVAFCDQDDFWKPEKLTEQLKVIQEKEGEYGEGCPVLVHTDLSIVDEEMRDLGQSYWQSRNVSSEKQRPIDYLLTKNYVTGCTMLANRGLIQLSLPIPLKVIMHDWWLALMAAANGAIVGMPGRTVLYRSHSSNVVAGGGSRMKRAMHAALTRGVYLKEYMQITRDQAVELLNSDRLNGENREIVENYLAMYQLGWVKRRVQMLRNGYFKYGFFRRMLIFIYL